MKPVKDFYRALCNRNLKRPAIIKRLEKAGYTKSDFYLYGPYNWLTENVNEQDWLFYNLHIYFTNASDAMLYNLMKENERTC